MEISSISYSSIYLQDVPFTSGKFTLKSRVFLLFSNCFKSDDHSYELTKQILSHAILFPEDRVNNNPLVITKENDYDKLNDKTWTSITGNEHGNSPRIDIVMNDYPHIQFINIGSNSLMNITSLTISNLPELRVFIADYHSFYNTSSLTLSNLPKLSIFRTEEESFNLVNTVAFTDLPECTNIELGKKTFAKTTTLTLSNLPKLSYFYAESWSCRQVWDFNVTNVPFTNGVFTHESMSFYTFKPSLINADESILYFSVFIVPSF